MIERGMNKIIIVTRHTRLYELVKKYNTLEQAKFYIKHLGADFDDYEIEDKNYYYALNYIREIADNYARVQIIDRNFIPQMIFGKDDIVIILGQDGLVANVMKYLDNQPLIGVNPDVKRWDGILLPFNIHNIDKVLKDVINKKYSYKNITMAYANSKDGQKLYAVNDFFIGIKNHTSARYKLNFNNLVENQSSSGIIVSTGLGSTGWQKSVMTQFSELAKVFNMGNFNPTPVLWDADELTFMVREPYPGIFTQAKLVYGKIIGNNTVRILSQMPENGIIFSDGVEEDNITFLSGNEVEIGIADRKGRLVV